MRRGRAGTGGEEKAEVGARLRGGLWLVRFVRHSGSKAKSWGDVGRSKFSIQEQESIVTSIILLAAWRKDDGGRESKTPQRSEAATTPVVATQRPLPHCELRLFRTMAEFSLTVIRSQKLMTLAPVRPIELAEIHAARKRIAGTILRTPLVRLELGRNFPEVFLKLENLQPINAYKLRGAANAVALLSESERARGVWTISAGNAGQGVAYAAREAGVPCSVVAIETAPEAKLERMRALGATLFLVSYTDAWKALEERVYPGIEGTFIHPFDDDNFIAGHGTMGLEILEDAPDTATVLAAIGGGGLITGIGSALKALRPEIKIIGVEPETAAPTALSLAQGSPQKFPNWTASFVDGAGGQSVFPRMWERMKPILDDSLVVSLEETRKAMRMMAEKTRIIAEGAGALPLAAVLSGKSRNGPIVGIVSGGNVDLKKFCDLIAV